MLQKGYFLLKTFFQRLLENFLCVVWPCSIYLEGCLRSYLYARKKIRVIRHTNQKISMKTRFTLEKNPVVPDFPSDHCNDALGEGLSTSIVRIIQTHFHQKRRYAHEIFLRNIYHPKSISFNYSMIWRKFYNEKKFGELG